MIDRWPIVVCGPTKAQPITRIDGTEWLRSDTGALFAVPALEHLAQHRRERVPCYIDHDPTARMGDEIGHVVGLQWHRGTRSLVGTLTVHGEAQAEYLESLWLRDRLPALSMCCQTLSVPGPPNEMVFVIERLVSVDLVGAAGMGGRFLPLPTAEALRVLERYADGDALQRSYVALHLARMKRQ